mmetsp:Transcript_9298/g.22095  ORF Transcript_9298/g.22095 Transcript_9298/m.22095 type:complete len:206 (+) Transcript_9298:439-1056(+)
MTKCSCSPCWYASGFRTSEFRLRSQTSRGRGDGSSLSPTRHARCRWPSSPCHSTPRRLCSSGPAPHELRGSPAVSPLTCGRARRRGSRGSASSSSTRGRWRRCSSTWERGISTKPPPYGRRCRRCAKAAGRPAPRRWACSSIWGWASRARSSTPCSPARSRRRMSSSARAALPSAPGPSRGHLTPRQLAATTSASGQRKFKRPTS